MTATELLGKVLSRARATVGRSPEQVGEQVGVSGRTIRRLEEGTSARPRRTTLQALASYYGLNREFLLALGDWSASRITAADVSDRVRDRAERELGAEVVQALGASRDDDVELVMRLARGPQSGLVPLNLPGSGRMQTALTLLQTLKGPGAPWSSERERLEVLTAVGSLIALDKRRRRVVAELIEQLHEAQAGAWSKSDVSGDSGTELKATVSVAE